MDLEMRPQRSQKSLDECDTCLSTKVVNEFKNWSIVFHAKELVE